MTHLREVHLLMTPGSFWSPHIDLSVPGSNHIFYKRKLRQCEELPRALQLLLRLSLGIL